MRFLLDTCTISTHVRRLAGLQARFVQYAGRLYLPTLALAELYVLAFRLDDPTERLATIAEIIRNEVEVIDFDADCALVFGQLRAAMLRHGTVTSSIDLLIASVALAHDLTLVTNNTRHFDHIPGLRLADWLTP